jgi:hypothetical protein
MLAIASLLICFGPQFVTMTSRGNGRIRVTDDTFATVGADVEVRNEHTSALNDTKLRENAIKTRHEHRLRLKKLIAWWGTEYKDYFAVGTKVLSQQERDDTMMHYHTCDRDIIYEGLRVDMILAYMAGNKHKPNGKLYSHTHMRKMHDAILFGARTVKKSLPSSYYSEMDTFLSSFKKEEAKAKSEGNVDERSADPITFSLFRRILTWALESGNMFVWVWTVLQWNLMARSISIDPLALHNISVSEDHFIFRHDSTKSDKKGAKLHNKSVYCNPLDPTVCVGVSLGVWLCLEQEGFQDSEKLFLRGDAKVGSAGHRYCSQLLQLLKSHWAIVMTFIKTLSAHGIRKGSATHVASSTTVPPPIASIAARGDWSLGKVLDIYWQFAQTGDNYLGRCISGLDPNSSKFSILPPHWNVPSPFEDVDIKEALHLMYPNILKRFPLSTGVLVRLLASVVYAADWLIEFASTKPGHPFNGIPLLQNPLLLARLKAKVTLETTDSMRHPTGVPPHVAQMNLLTSLLELCQITLQKVSDQETTVRQSIFDAMEERATENGQITRTQIVTILDEFRKGVSDDVSNQIKNLQAHGIGVPPAPANNQQANSTQAGTLFWHSGKFWDVPEDFEFPKGLKRNVGWKLWLQGMPGHNMIDESGNITVRPIKPFRAFVPGRLPKKIADTYKLHWRPLFQIMEEGLDDIPPMNPSTEISEALYNQATLHLQTRVGFIFENKKFNQNNWAISTWAKHVKRSMIVSKGTAQDKANLPDENRFNRGHTGRKRRVEYLQHTRVARRQAPTTAPVERETPANSAPVTRRRRPASTQAAARAPPRRASTSSATDSSTDSDDSVDPTTRRAGRDDGRERQHANQDNGFATAFELTPLSTAAQARGRFFERRVREEMDDERKETPEEARRRKRNEANGLSVRPTGNNKNSNDKEYPHWLQEQVREKNLQARCEKMFSGEDSDGSERSN